MSIDPSSAKYLIKAKIKVDGAVEKSDVIGAIFGQTEGLIGDSLDLRDLQKSARVGRIEVDMHQKNGKSEGTLTLTSALEKVETAIIAAGIESVDRIGPCKAEINIDKVEDIRISKRKHVIDRAKNILTGMISEGREEIEDIVETIRQSVQVEEIEYYGKDRLPSGPNVSKSDGIIVVEGRNDVVNLLKHGIKNTISVEGTSVPQSIVDLCTEKIATAFVDGDRGGELILKELLQVADIDFVARAPKTREVEELPYKLIMKALKNKIPAEQYMEMHGIERKNNRVNKKKNNNESELSDKQKNYKKLLSEVKGTLTAILLNKDGTEIDRVKVDSLVNTLSKNKAHTVIFDGITTQRLIDTAFDRGVSTIISTKEGEISKIPTSLTIITEDRIK
ncbi:MAG: DNA primase DnaG [Candidatus Thermoplasmatota archaeon]|nr:DNA primase DnaG [Candidatus Thermoplasmatota archaeon]